MSLKCGLLGFSPRTFSAVCVNIVIEAFTAILTNYYCSALELLVNALILILTQIQGQAPGQGGFRRCEAIIGPAAWKSQCDHGG